MVVEELVQELRDYDREVGLNQGLHVHVYLDDLDEDGAIVNVFLD